MMHPQTARCFALAAALTVAASGLNAAHAQAITDNWTSVPMPAAPTLEPATVDAASSALLVLDMYTTSCSTAQRPRCVVDLPHVQKLLADARAHKMLVIYSAGPIPANGQAPAQTYAAPQMPGEPTVHGGPDKFMGSDLEQILKDHGIKTVIVTGTSADGAVLYTASHAALLNIKAVIPVDCISSVNPFSELYTVWHLKNTLGLIANKVTLTKADLVTIK